MLNITNQADLLGALKQKFEGSTISATFYYFHDTRVETFTFSLLVGEKYHSVSRSWSPEEPNSFKTPSIFWSNLYDQIVDELHELVSGGFYAECIPAVGTITFKEDSEIPAKLKKQGVKS